MKVLVAQLLQSWSCAQATPVYSKSSEFFFLLKQDTKMAHVAQLRNNIHNKSALSSYIQMFCSSRSCIEKVSDFSSNILNIEADINSIYPNEHEITTDISVSPITTKTTWRV